LIGRLISHSFGCVVDHGPPSITSSLRVMIAWILVNVHVHVHVQSASQIFPMLRRCVLPNAGKRSMCVAVSRSFGRLRLAVCVDVMVDPSGKCTLIGFVVSFLFWHGMSNPLKCLVAPVSATALIDGGEGPRVWEASSNDKHVIFNYSVTTVCSGHPFLSGRCSWALRVVGDCVEWCAPIVESVR
jgi:hypothetical protein